MLLTETLVYSHTHVLEVFLCGFNKPTLLLCESRPRVCGLVAYVRSGYSAEVRKDNVYNWHEVQ